MSQKLDGNGKPATKKNLETVGQITPLMDPRNG